MLARHNNTFIEYKGQRHFLRMATYPEVEKHAAISEFVRSKYPNDEFNPEDIEWEHCWPIAPPTEASLFLRCPLADIEKLQKKGNIEFIQITAKLNFLVFSY